MNKTGQILDVIVFLVLLLLTISTPRSLRADDQLLSFGETLSVETTGSNVAVLSRHKVSMNAQALSQSFTLAVPGYGEVSGKPSFVNDYSHGKGYSTKSVSGKLYRTDSSAVGEYVLARTTSSDGTEGYHGNFTTPDGRLFILGEDSDHALMLSEIDETKQLECGGAAIPDRHDLAHSHRAQTVSTPSAKATAIRVLVAYTPDAVTKAGSESALLSIISAMVSNGNAAHTNSQTGVTLQLVGTYALSTSSNDNFTTELSQATDTTDGKWDELGTLREQYCADMVSVIVGGTNGGQICGIGWIGGTADKMSLYKNLMYSLVSADQEICSEYTFVHELGHNFGSDHDIANTSSQSHPSYSYSYGWRFNGGSGPQYRTVMSYSPGTRIAHFSNPAISYDGVATGVSGSADNSASHILTSPIVEAFYGEGESCLAAPPASGPDAIQLTSTSKKKGSRTRVKIQMYVTAQGVAVPSVALRLVYDKKPAGTFEKKISEKSTNTKGVATYNAYLDRLKSGYYQACFYGTTQTICSNQLRKRGSSARSRRRR